MDKIVETDIESIYHFLKEYPEYKNQIQVETRFGYFSILECDITAYNSEIIKIETENNEIKCSPNHKIFVNENWIDAKNINENNLILTKQGYQKIKSIKKLEFKDDLFDLQVDKVNEYYTNEIVSHNSVLLDALSFCLYGKPYRKIKIEELTNRKNKSNLLVTCNFTVDSKDTYTIIRGLEPNIISIKKNDEELELLSSKRLNQDEIDKIIGINHQLFRQVISLAVNYNKPFLTLSAMEKRDIVEQIFNIKVFGQMLKIVKKNSVEIKTKNDLNDRSLSLLEQHIKSLRRRVAELTEAKSNFQQNKENDLKSIDERIKSYINESINIDEEIKKIDCILQNNQYNQETLQLLKKKKDQLVKSINEKEYFVKTSNEMIELLKTNDICPWCKSDITNEHKETEITRVGAEIEQATNLTTNLKIEKIEVDNNINFQEKAYHEFNENTNHLKGLKSKLELIKNELSVAEERRNEILNREIDFNLDKVNTEFNEKTEEYKLLWKDQKNLQKNLKVNDVVQNILSESGIKAYFFKKLVPILNTKINEYIKIFEIPIVLQFDALMNEKISNLENIRNEISYYSYSEGEKKRIDMAILLSFISITKIISNWNCNLLIIDELLDGAIDENGLEKLVTSLKNMTYESKDLAIYVISHRLQQDYSSQFKNCLYVSKNNNGFSEITYEREIE
jgi:DNA repair exonuclease SbcCD ATPase subunit